MDHVMILRHLVVDSEGAKHCQFITFEEVTLPGILIGVAFDGLPVSSIFVFIAYGERYSPNLGLRSGLIG